MRSLVLAPLLVHPSANEGSMTVYRLRVNCHQVNRHLYRWHSGRVEVLTSVGWETSYVFSDDSESSYLAHIDLIDFSCEALENPAYALDPEEMLLLLTHAV